ncbi:MAG: hypothetical protein QM536_00130 [Chitinophagaceae bacterium]|nr:hypothetical protein [Chitinophagaceae bacterium]
MTANERIEKACVDAKEKLHQLDIEPTIQAELEYVIASYRYDKNPIGLYEIAEKAYRVLLVHKEKYPKSVSKKMVEDIEKAIKTK